MSWSKTARKSLIPSENGKGLRAVFLAMRLLEDDYLGASGTRGYGKIKFQNITVKWRPIDFYRDPQKHAEVELWCGDDLRELLARFDELFSEQLWGKWKTETLSASA
jgi:Uncharacterized protein predicted to be involved in DNA repair (RAMP superfamily)